MAGREEAFSEVAGDDLVWIPDSGEIYASVPALEYIDISRYILQLTLGEGIFAEKRLEQLRDAEGIHSTAIVAGERAEARRG